MKLMRVGPLGSETPLLGITRPDGGDDWFDASSVTATYDRRFFAEDGPARVAAAHAAGALPAAEVTPGMRIGAPVVDPQALLCIGMNYAAHAAESGAEPPAQPVLFLKTPNTIAGPDDTARIPRRSTTTDWEVELGIVIGQRCSYLADRQEAAAAIAGYVLADDLSERNFQMHESGGQWSKGKCAPGFSPLGPWFVSADALDPSDLAIRSWVNGEIRQDSNTRDMIFDVEEIVHHLSQYLVLEPGDVILTGTPEGVALSGRFEYLRAGDVVEVEITGLGRQRHEFVDA